MRVVRKKRKNTYLLTRCGSGYCTFEDIYKSMQLFVYIWARMQKMNFIRDGDVSGLRNGWSKALTLSDLEVFRRFSIFTILHGNASIEVYTVQDRPSFFTCNFSWISVQRNPWIVHPRSRCGIEPSTLRWSRNLHMDFFELEWWFLEVSRALFFKAGPPYYIT